MIKITLFCAAGMSTSVLVEKMKAAAKTKGVEAVIEAFPESTMSKKLEEGIDVALLGPQVRYKLPNAKKLCGAKGVPVDVINSVDYGMMKGDKVLDFALKLLNK
ncbi:MULTISPECIES: PTS sugar transporter subunit IIB [Clostridium]|jgi:PTS system cellobiose-specific IIB component|uniref:Cellobiose-specific phosphotransferase enzyme IIB component CelA n=3 Tax=Clostridium intestinale TaxID=36845 RepID=U2NMK1_9CLOT|nr:MULTISPECIES: PTS sugar transporter subunit IIB [Clostridium]ERK30393.1 cellobiose-specific phosphotransferase enzyme IIB component CelA [Clostridium intestinale URNW]QLY82103.1 PTS sugar transporter subunit IIB [Clostridium intestinale]WRY52942.1 PTS sugar transporter subunit IIB [Clostridium intestinale]SHH59173.1 PTS system, cellobiose-specific IIB component [Clostridium intestinale DSM 6191]